MQNLTQKFMRERWDAIKGGKGGAADRVVELMEVADFEQMESIRARADAVLLSLCSVDHVSR